ncbi:hypothetical protein QE152_g32169 [Popillia japonica]|uniref:Uncharacterized protein n=1 Tax=Popillia japonica TaxID=7064 RepID=A0AAW1J0K3_POPJA
MYRSCYKEEFFENPASTVVVEELDDSDSVRDESLGESSTNGTENINHGVVSNDALESADERDDDKHTEYMALASAVQEAMWLKQFGQIFDDKLKTGTMEIIWH